MTLAAGASVLWRRAVVACCLDVGVVKVVS